MAEVVIVGGGPVGLWLAAELDTAGVDVVVLEQLAERLPYSKALTVYPRTLEQFAMRGLVEPLLAEGLPVPSSHFALLDNRLDFTVLAPLTRYPFTLFLPQVRTEALLEGLLAARGVPVLRQRTVVGVTQDERGVAVDAETPSGPATFRARYVVGCDGAASVVRKSAGIAFGGTPTTQTSLVGDAEVTDPPPARAQTLNRPGGSFYMVSLGGGRFRMATIDHALLDVPKDKPLTFAEFRDSVRRVAGTDYGMRNPIWLSRVGNATMQAVAYRNGRILLAGDAAHIHTPMGGQGLNLGLQDATNLAWKLAAVVNGWAPESLLDTYQAERYPVGERVVEDTLAQYALVSNVTREGRALRARFNELLGSHPSLSRELSVRLAGLDVAYPGPGPGAGGHPLSGRRVPDLELEGGGPGACDKRCRACSACCGRPGSCCSTSPAGGWSWPAPSAWGSAPAAWRSPPGGWPRSGRSGRGSAPCCSARTGTSPGPATTPARRPWPRALSSRFAAGWIKRVIRDWLKALPIRICLVCAHNPCNR